MRLKTLFAAVLALSVSHLTHAQSTEQVCTPGVHSYFGYGTSGRQGVAFTMKVKSSTEQRLPDGSYIRGYVYATQARTSKGKTLSQMPIGCFRDKDGRPEQQLNVNVFDIESKTTENWAVGDPFQDKVAHIHHQRPAMPPVKLSPEELAARRKANEGRQPPQSEFKTEDLGTRMIAGVEARGSRTTRTIPSGEEGNEVPLVVVTEDWRSHEFGIDLMHINDDPRIGRHIWEVEELSLAEPDPALFNPPSDYKVSDDNPPEETVAKQ